MHLIPPFNSTPNRGNEAEKLSRCCSITAMDTSCIGEAKAPSAVQTHADHQTEHQNTIFYRLSNVIGTLRRDFSAAFIRPLLQGCKNLLIKCRIQSRSPRRPRCSLIQNSGFSDEQRATDAPCISLRFNDLLRSDRLILPLRSEAYLKFRF
jgi:hypothetical protein